MGEKSRRGGTIVFCFVSGVSRAMVIKSVVVCDYNEVYNKLSYHEKDCNVICTKG